MQNYLISKSAEYMLLLQWIKDEIRNLRDKKDYHKPIFSDLDVVLSEIESETIKLDKIANMDDDSFNLSFSSRAVTYLRVIEYKLLFLTKWYLPALYNENENDLILREILLEISKYCGLEWIDDIIVCLNRDYSTVPVKPNIPIIYAPPHQSSSLIGMTIFHHEFGHNVYTKFEEEIGRLLLNVVSKHFNHKSVTSPEELRNRQFAMNYWNNKRLNELFSDVYGCLIGGPSYYFACVDMVIKNNLFVFQITPEIHPSPATRVYVCYKVLSDVHKDDKTVEMTKKFWDDYVFLNRKPDPNFGFLCDNDLIDKLVETSMECITRLVPKAEHCCERLDYKKLEDDFELQPLNDRLNCGLRILLKNPDKYHEWEKEVLGNVKG